MILIALFVGFLIYDFYSFVTNNTPYVSNYPVGTPSGVNNLLISQLICQT